MNAAYSLRGRLLGWLILATAAIGVLALADTWREAQATARGLSDRVLAGAAMAIAEKVTLDESGGLDVEVPFSALEMLASPADDKVFYRVDGANGAFLTGYQNLAPVAVGPQGIGFSDAVFGTESVRSATVSRALSTGSKLVSFTITVAETNQARNALARTILMRSALRIGALVAAVILIVWLAVTLALRPLDRIGAAMEARAPNDLSPITMPVPQEAMPLVAGLNTFMARLAAALAALRNFTGNASHQLRTPLSVVGAQLALARRAGTGAAGDNALTQAESALARAERVLAQLLVLARVDASASQGGQQDADIAVLAREIVAEFIPAALKMGSDLGHDGLGSLRADVEPVLFGELLRNLLDNALKYTPAGTVVTVRTDLAEGFARLTVEDDGPGLSAATLGKWRQGGRMDFHHGRAPAAPGGHGLGFAIVNEIAERFGARVALATRPEFAGTRITVAFRLPGAPQARA